MVVGGVCLLLLGLGLSAGFEDYFSRLLSGALIRSPVLSNSGIWTFLLALLAAPLAWYLWLIRDRNRLQEFSNTRLKELREYFYRLQEWATDSEHPSRQVTALFQLRDFLRGDRVLIPRELAGERRRFVRMAREFIVVLLRNRTLWESTGESDARSREGGDRAPGVVAGGTQDTESEEAAWESVRHPVQAALEAILIEDGYRLRDLSGADLTGFHLPGANLEYCVLDGASLRYAHLLGAFFTRAVLPRVDFSHAQLSLAELSNANLYDANLTDAMLASAKLVGANLKRCNLIRTIFGFPRNEETDSFSADLASARISIRWRPILTDYKGTPIWCDDETGEPLDPQPTPKRRRPRRDNPNYSDD